LPKELTHWIVAERACKELSRDSRLFGVIDHYKKEYLAGAVLPDTLLHLFSGPHAKSALSAAGRFHNTDENSYEPLISVEAELGQELSDPVLSCLLGVITHMQSDIVFHPYIFALTGTDDIGRHYKLETEIDMYLTSNRLQPPVNKLLDLVTPETEKTIISVAELLFSTTFQLSCVTFSDSLRLHCRFQSMYSKNFWKFAVKLLGMFLGKPYSQQRHLFYPIELLGKQDFKHMSETIEWEHPVSGEARKSNVDELVADAVSRTVEVFRRIELENSLVAALLDPPGCNLLTGMYAVNSSKMFKAK